MKSMCEWKVTINNKEEIYFVNFHDAVQSFRNNLADYLINHSHNSLITDEPILYTRSAVPMDIATYFGELYDTAKMTDEEILIETRLSMLMESLLCKDAEKAKYRAMDAISMEFDYKFNKTNEVKVIIESTCMPKEITVDLKTDDCFLQTNAFLIEDSALSYYFNSSIVCHTSSIDEDLGKKFEYSIKLESII